MTRFNTPTLSPGYVARTPDTVNLAGGEAWTQDPELALASLATTSMVKDQYYRTADEGLNDLRTLLGQVDPYYAAQVAVYTRNEDGLRSITHALAGELAATVKGEAWAKNFYRAVIRRPDDATEIVAYYLQHFGKPLPNSLKKGVGLALGKFDAYQLAKYKGEKHGLSLVDVVNLVHPRPTDRNAEALAQLVDGKLVSTETWESKLSAAGQSEDAEGAKAEAWSTLLREKRLGYMALLKNLRNIAEQAPDLVPLACEALLDKEAVHKSLVLPFRFVTAGREVQHYPQLLEAISGAVDLALDNMPDLGTALVAVDGSGSMQGAVAGNEQLSRMTVGALFGAALYKKNYSDVLVFGRTAGPVSGLNPADSTFSNAERILTTCYGHETNFHTIFETAGLREYDTIVIFSDMQAWVKPFGYGSSHPAESFRAYKRRTGCDPKVFAFDLAGYGTAQFPEKNVFQLSGFSDDSLKLIEQYRKDPRALVTAIKAVTF